MIFISAKGNLGLSIIEPYALVMACVKLLSVTGFFTFCSSR